MEKLENETQISTVEMHTGGDPVRIATSGFPQIKGDTILAKRQYVKENLDHLRKLLIFEPRGHYDMYGALIVQPDLEQADFAVLFFHKGGYSTMCGHATIAVARYAVDSGLASRDKATPNVDDIPVSIQCPCGVVKAFVEINQGRSGRVHFQSVPAYAFAVDLKVETQKFGTITIDIGYGGTFYAFVGQDQIKMNLPSTEVKELKEAADILSQDIKKQVKLRHPESEQFEFLYGIIFTDGNGCGDAEAIHECSNNICVYAENQVCRAPCGSGVTARIAVEYAKKLIGLNQPRTFQGLAGSKFKAKAVNETKYGEFDAVHVEVCGQAYYTGTATFTVEKDDPFQHGFILQ